MCFKTPKMPDVQAPPLPAAPMRSDEAVKGAVDAELDNIRRKRGTGSTNLTGGLGDSSFGSNATPRTLLGQ